MKLDVPSTGSITEKGFALLEGATAFYKIAKKIEDAIKPSQKIITMTKQDAAATAKMLRQAVAMIENLLSQLEQRELPKIDQYGHRVGILAAPVEKQQPE